MGCNNTEELRPLDRPLTKWRDAVEMDIRTVDVNASV
jgi:hypothetical protein